MVAVRMAQSQSPSSATAKASSLSPVASQDSFVVGPNSSDTSAAAVSLLALSASGSVSSSSDVKSIDSTTTKHPPRPPLSVSVETSLASMSERSALPTSSSLGSMSSPSSYTTAAPSLPPAVLASQSADSLSSPAPASVQKEPPQTEAMASAGSVRRQSPLPSDSPSRQTERPSQQHVQQFETLIERLRKRKEREDSTSPAYSHSHSLSQDDTVSNARSSVSPTIALVDVDSKESPEIVQKTEKPKKKKTFSKRKRGCVEARKFALQNPELFQELARKAVSDACGPLTSSATIDPSPVSVSSITAPSPSTESTAASTAASDFTKSASDTPALPPKASTQPSAPLTFTSVIPQLGSSSVASPAYPTDPLLQARLAAMPSYQMQFQVNAYTSLPPFGMPHPMPTLAYPQLNLPMGMSGMYGVPPMYPSMDPMALAAQAYSNQSPFLNPMLGGVSYPSMHPTGYPATASSLLGSFMPPYPPMGPQASQFSFNLAAAAPALPMPMPMPMPSAAMTAAAMPPSTGAQHGGQGYFHS